MTATVDAEAKRFQNHFRCVAGRIEHPQGIGALGTDPGNLVRGLGGVDRRVYGVIGEGATVEGEKGLPVQLLGSDPMAATGGVLPFGFRGQPQMRVPAVGKTWEGLWV